MAALGCLACCGVLGAAALGINGPARLGLAAYVIGWAALAAASVALSVPGWLGRWPLVYSLAVLAAVTFGAWVGVGRPFAASLDPGWRLTLRDPVVAALALAVLAGGIYLGALAVLTTPNDWDGLTYHETRALLWDQQGGVGYVPSGNDPRLDGNPPVSEIGLYLAIVLPRSERFGAISQYLALWASLVAVVVLARRLGLSRPAAAYAGLIFTTLPVVILHGAAILNDLLVGSFLLVAAVFLTSRVMSELAVGSVALALALSTKFSAVLALPLVLAVVLAGVPRDRRRRTAVACGVGVILGSPWYVLNLMETGSFDGDLGETTGQAADHSFRTVVGSFRALTFDVVDTSGLWRSEMYIAVGLGAALVAGGLIRALRGRAGGSVLALAGLVTALTPLILRSLARPARFLWEEAWSAVGREDIAHDHPIAWDVLSVPDTSLSWYGAAGAIVILGGIVAAIVAVRRGELGKLALLFALAPLILVATFAVTIVYDPWRGRLLIFGVGLACAAWGWTYRVRWLSVGVASLCVTTLALSLVHSFTKPSGIGLLEPAISRSVWHRDRIDTLTLVRNYDGTPGLLRAVASHVPQNDPIAVATPVDVFLAPLAGPQLSRPLRLVKDGARVPAGAGWVVTRPSARALGCAAAWKTVFSEDEYHWRLLQRVAPDACGGEFVSL
jgi:4-amino-4-deoxy-L-arabinose transferase-like glycosyltransferase